MPEHLPSTPRLLLRPADLGDAPFILALLNSPNWLAGIGDRGVRDLDAARDYIATRLIHSYEQRGFGLYVSLLRQDGQPIGLCGFVQRPDLPCPDLGFAVLPAFEGQGYTSEAAQALMAHARQHWGFGQVLGIVTAQNLASQRVLSRCGLRPIGHYQHGAEKLRLFST